MNLIELKKEIAKSSKIENKNIKNILNNMPILYVLALYCILVLDMVELVIEGARESGKTIFFQTLILLYSELYPEGDIVVTRDNINEHMRGLVPRIQRLLRDSWLVELFPSLREFYFDQNEMWFVRTHANGHKQKIWFIGEKMGGIQKNKSVSPDGYFSLVLKDEAEGNNNLATEINTIEIRKKLTEDKKRTFRRRDYEKYKNYLIYPRTKFGYAYNPKEESGEFEDLMNQFLKPNVTKLDEDGFQFKIIPNYKNGSGLVLIRNNINHLINDNREFWPSQESIREARWFKENEPTIYRMDYLGIRYENETAFFSHYKNVLRNKVDKQFIPISLGLDQGLTDDTEAILNINEFVKENNKIVYTQLNGAVSELSFKGKRLMTAKSAKEHIIYAARDIVNYLNENVFSNEDWVNHYQNEDPFTIAVGHKDKWLLSEIEEIYEKEFPQYEKVIDFLEIKEVVSKYDIEERIKLEQSTNKKRTNILSEKLTPELWKAYLKYGKNNYKSDKWNGLNKVDAYFYSKYKFYSQIREDKKIYNYYENGGEE